MVIRSEEPLESGSSVSLQKDRSFTLAFTTMGESTCIVVELSAKSMLLKGQQDTLDSL